MQKHLFLCGAPGCGKTTMLRRALGAAAPKAGGFVTVRVCRPDGKILGYDLVPAAAAGGSGEAGSCRFMFYQGDKLQTDSEVFRTEGVRLLKEAARYPFSLIDEFGGFEMLLPQFREALTEFLSLGQPCIGVVKDPRAADALCRRLGLGEEYISCVRRLYAFLESSPDTLVLKTFGAGDTAARRTVEQWVREYVCTPAP